MRKLKNNCSIDSTKVIKINQKRSNRMSEEDLRSIFKSEYLKYNSKFRYTTYDYYKNKLINLHDKTTIG